MAHLTSLQKSNLQRVRERKEAAARKRGIRKMKKNQHLAESGNRVFLWPSSPALKGTCAARVEKLGEYPVFLLLDSLIDIIIPATRDIMPGCLTLGRLQPKTMLRGVSCDSFLRLSLLTSQSGCGTHPREELSYWLLH
jgi:hypothetical protein